MSENKIKKAKTGASSKKSKKVGGASGNHSSSAGHTSPAKPVTQVPGEQSSPTENENSNDFVDSPNHESTTPKPEAPGSILRAILGDLGQHGTLSMAEKSHGKSLLIEAARESFTALEKSWRITNALELLEHYDLLKSDLQENKRNSGRYDLLLRTLSARSTETYCRSISSCN
jgi:hypothetical protein